MSKYTIFLKINKINSKVFVYTFILFFIWFRSFISTMVELSNLDRSFVLILQAFFIFILFTLNIKNILFFIKSNRNFRIFIYLVFLIVFLIHLSNEIKNIRFDNYYKDESSVLLLEWYIQVINIFIYYIIGQYIIFHNKLKLFFLYLILFLNLLLLYSAILTYLNLSTILGAGEVYFSLISGGNKMFFGKIIFIDFMLLIILYNVWYKNNNKVALTIILLFLILILYALLIRTRTPIFALLLLVSIAMYYHYNFRKKVFLFFISKKFFLTVFSSLIIFSILNPTLIETLLRTSSQLNLLQFDNFDRFTSSRYSAAMLSTRLFLSNIINDPISFFFGYGNFYAALMFKPFYANHKYEYDPTSDLSYFLEQGEQFEPHNAYNAIMLSNGLFAYIVLIILIFFVISVSKKIKNNLIIEEFKILSKYLYIFILIIVFVYFSSDLDFKGNGFMTQAFFISFIFNMILYKYQYYMRVKHEN